MKFQILMHRLNFYLLLYPICSMIGIYTQTYSFILTACLFEEVLFFKETVLFIKLQNFLQA